MATKTPNILQRYPLAAYFVLAYAITWGGSIVYYLSTPAGGRALPAFLLLPAAIVWYYGPALSALLVTRANEGPGSIRRLLGGLLKWRVGWRWYAFIVVYPLALHLLVVGLDWLMGGPAPVFFEASGVPEGNPLLILLGLALLQFFQRGIGEETGWRAFALPRLQSRWNPFTASLVLGVLWAGWHFHPANFPMLISEMGVYVFLNIVAATVIFTWVFNNTGGSLLAAALFHTTLNVSDWVVPLGVFGGSPRSTQIQVVVLWLLVGALLLRYGLNLGARKPQPAG